MKYREYKILLEFIEELQEVQPADFKAVRDYIKSLESWLMNEKLWKSALDMIKGFISNLKEMNKLKKREKDKTKRKDDVNEDKKSSKGSSKSKNKPKEGDKIINQVLTNLLKDSSVDKDEVNSNELAKGRKRMSKSMNETLAKMKGTSLEKYSS